MDSQNDLDLDMFCHDVIRADMEHLKRTPCRNALLGSRHLGEQVLSDEYDQTEDHGRVEDVFGTSCRSSVLFQMYADLRVPLGYHEI